MPFVRETDVPVGMIGAAAPAPAPTPDPTLMETVGAAARSSNEVVSTFRYLRDRTGQTLDPTHNPLDVIGGTKYEDRHLGRFAGSWNETDTRAIMRRIDEEEEDSRILAASGWAGTVAKIGMGIASPTILLPGGALYRGARLGESVARSAASVGIAGGAGAAVQEGILYGTRETGTAEEALTGIAAGTVLAGLLGAGAGALLSRAERAAIEPLVQADIARVVDRDDGFTIDAFHGTGGDFVDFDMARRGEATGAPSARKAFWFAKSADTANFYADVARARGAALTPEEASTWDMLAGERAGYEQRAVDLAALGRRGFERLAETPDADIDFLLGGRPATADEFRALGRQQRDMIVGEAERLTKELRSHFRTVLDRLEPAGESVRPVRLRMQNPLVHDFKGAPDREVSFADLLDRAQREGHDGAIFRNVYDGGPANDDIYAVFDPAQARSRYDRGPGFGAGLRAGRLREAQEQLAVLQRELVEMQTAPPDVREGPVNRMLGGGNGTLLPANQNYRPEEALALPQSKPGETEQAYLLMDVLEAIDGGRPYSLDRLKGFFKDPAPIERMLQEKGELDSVDVMAQYLREHPDLAAEESAWGEILSRAAAPSEMGVLSSPLMPDPEQVARQMLAAANDRPPVRRRMEEWEQDAIFQVRSEIDALQQEIADLTAAASPPSEVSGTGLPASGGAAASDVRQMELARGPLGIAKGVARVLNKTPYLNKVFGSPTTQVFLSRFTSARRAMGDLAETALAFEEAQRGVTPVRGGGPAADREVRLAYGQAKEAIGSGMDRLFMQYRFGKEGEPSILAAQAGKTRALLEGGAEKTGKMQMQEFREAVGRAMRDGDRSEIPEVQSAAQLVRKQVDIWKDRAIAAKLLPSDVTPETAASYLMRVYNKTKINAERPEFQRVIGDWLESEQTKKAATKERLADLDKSLREVRRKVGKIDRRIARYERDEERLFGRLAEREIEVASAGRRADALAERTGSIDEELTEVAEFVAAMRAEVKDPALLERVNRLSEEAAALRRQDRALSEDDLARVEEQELRGILSGQARLIAEVLVGKRKPTKPPSFLSWIIKEGGVTDPGGEILASLGGKTSTRPGLINAAGRDPDRLGEFIGESFPGDLGGVRPSVDDVLGWIDESANGREPWFYVESLPDDYGAKVRASEAAAALEEAFFRAGVEVKTTRDVAKVFRDESGAAMTLDDLDRITAEMEAVGADIPASGRRAAVEEDLGVTKAGIAEARALVAKAIGDRNRLRAKRTVEGARSSEADLRERASLGRLGVLDRRLALNEARRDLLAAARQNAEDASAAIREKIETELKGWQGDSATKALLAIGKRAEAERVRGLKQEAGVYEGKGGRLTGADAEVDAAVQSILKSDRDMSRGELDARAGEVVDRLLGGPDGRLPYDAPAGGPQMGPPGDQPRGPLAMRDFMIPDRLIEPWLVSDVEQVMNDFLRSIVPDVVLTERFGDVNMLEEFKKLAEEHGRLSAQATSAKERKAIDDEYEQTVTNLAAVRDRVRNTYGFDPKLRNAARVAQAARLYNGISDLGGSTLNSLSDTAGAIFRHGFLNVMGDGWRPFFKGLTRMSDAYPQAKRQFRAMGIAVEMRTNARSNDAYDLVEQYRPENRLERTLSVGGDLTQILNLQAPWTDFGKTVASVVTANEIFRAGKAVTAGTATKKQVRQLAESGIDPALATRIWRQFQDGGATVDGVMLPNTADWTDAGARRAFEGAVAREADIAIITPGMEKPLWMSNPLLGVLGQFKSFAAAATERLLIANLQRADAQTLSGLMAGVTAGMFSYALYSLNSGQALSDRPQDWVREGVSRSGVLGWFEEANAFASKATWGRADVYRLVGSDKPLTRFASRSAGGQLLGPTWGKIESVLGATGAAASGSWTAADTRRVRGLLPWENLIGIRRVLDEVEESVNGMFGVPARRQ